MRRLTREQLQTIKKILEEGKHQDRHRDRIQIKIDNLYQAFTTYCRLRGIGNKCWKVRYFRHNPRRLYSSRYDTRGGLYEDIPMSTYHIRMAVMHGVRIGDIEQVNQISQDSHNRKVYRFTRGIIGDGKDYDAAETSAAASPPSNEGNSTITG